VKRLIILLYFLCILNIAQSAVNFTVGAGQGAIASKEMADNNGQAAGQAFMVKVGFLDKRLEIGIYSSSGNFSTKLKHDSIDSDLKILKTGFGAYATYYSQTIYLEIGFGKTIFKETLTTTLAAAAEESLRNSYNLNDEEKTSTEVRVLAGLKIFKVKNLAFTFYAQITKQLEKNHQDTQLGFEIKLSIK